MKVKYQQYYKGNMNLLSILERDREKRRNMDGYPLRTVLGVAFAGILIGLFIGYSTGMGSASASVIDCYNTHLANELRPSGEAFAACLQNEGMSINLQE